MWDHLFSYERTGLATKHYLNNDINVKRWTMTSNQPHQSGQLHHSISSLVEKLNNAKNIEISFTNASIKFKFNPDRFYNANAL